MAGTNLLPSRQRGTTDGVTLLGKLLTIQAAHGWSDDQMAAFCGVKARMWRNLKTGDMALSSRVLGSIARSFPGLRDDVMAYMVGLAAIEAPAADPDTREAAQAA